MAGRGIVVPRDKGRGEWLEAKEERLSQRQMVSLRVSWVNHEMGARRKAHIIPGLRVTPIFCQHAQSSGMSPAVLCRICFGGPRKDTDAGNVQGPGQEQPPNL